MKKKNGGIAFMKRKIYTPLLLTALFMSTLSQTVPGTTANAAKKPALSKTKVSVYTGKKAKVSIKKIAKSFKSFEETSNKTFSLFFKTSIISIYHLLFELLYCSLILFFAM